MTYTANSENLTEVYVASNTYSISNIYVSLLLTIGKTKCFNSHNIVPQVARQNVSVVAHHGCVPLSHLSETKISLPFLYILDFL